MALTARRKRDACRDRSLERHRWRYSCVFVLRRRTFLEALLVFTLCFIVPSVRGVGKQCQNPLFGTHWFMPGGPPAQLSEKPELREDLRLCPAYNAEPSCCPQPLETQMMVHFRYWRATLDEKLHRVEHSRSAVESIGGSDIYTSASAEEREQHQIALQRFKEFLAPQNYQSCYTALLTYTAGMLCFACEAHWKNSLEFDEGKVIRVLLTETTCTKLWGECRELGKSARRLKQAILDSRLASMSFAPVENLEMFFDQQQLCDWMHDVVAMHPFGTPSEAEREAAPPPVTITRRLMGNETAPPTKWPFDALKAGRASGFDVQWLKVQEGQALVPSATVDQWPHAAFVITLMTLAW
eukprot:TRINITY_DN27562_c0_g1_i1.p1 TRINITY_DN27562_c0_g1~~TRINITY_DN27562_c0_g1_i1.p1  ORF type:complete len:354 (-),score=51.47 TRINITY_DN27562_c0_g1_i1:394-1455(-)